MKSYKEATTQYRYKSKVFSLFLLDDGRIQIRTLANGSGSGRPKNLWILQIRIKNTAREDKAYVRRALSCKFLLYLVGIGPLPILRIVQTSQPEIGQLYLTPARIIAYTS